MHHSISWKKSVVIAFLICLNGILPAQPIGYYNGTENLSGEQLKSALHEIIKDHVDFSYSEAKYLINYSDADPENPNNVILFAVILKTELNKFLLYQLFFKMPHSKFLSYNG